MVAIIQRHNRLNGIVFSIVEFSVFPEYQGREKMRLLLQ